MVRLVVLLTLPLIIDPFHTWKPLLIRKDTKLCLYGIRERWECSTLFLSQSTRRCPYLRETFGEVWALSSLLTETTGTGNVRLRWMLVQSSTLTDRTSTPPTSSTLSPPTSSPRPDSLNSALETVLHFTEASPWLHLVEAVLVEESRDQEEGRVPFLTDHLVKSPRPNNSWVSVVSTSQTGLTFSARSGRESWWSAGGSPSPPRTEPPGSAAQQ